MNRIKALWKASPRRVLGAACAVSVAGAVVVGSGANFTSVTANPGNSFTTGTLTHSNSRANAAILTATGIKPGDSTTGTVDIANNGNTAATLTLKKNAVTSSDPTYPLAAKLNVKIDDCGTPEAGAGVCTSPTEIYNGTISTMADEDLSSWAVNAAHRYKFTVSFPNGSASSDNNYQGDSASVEYQWEAVQ